jgi:hypothetical protein
MKSVSGEVLQEVFKVEEMVENNEILRLIINGLKIWPRVSSNSQFMDHSYEAQVV